MFECADCGTSVLDTADWETRHDCPSDHNVPKWIVWVSLWLTGAAMALGVLIGATIAYDAVADPSEDSGSIMLNCHVYGDGECGPDAPWHGYINLF